MPVSTTPYNLFSNLCVMPKRRTQRSTFASRVQYILDQEGLKKAELARRLGVSRAAVTEWMKSRSLTPRANVPFLFEDKLGYSARWVATGDGEPKPHKFDPTDTIIIDDLRKLNPTTKEAVRDFIQYQVNRSHAI